MSILSHYLEIDHLLYWFHFMWSASAKEQMPIGCSCTKHCSNFCVWNVNLCLIWCSTCIPKRQKLSHQYGATFVSSKSSIMYNPILQQGPIAIILATANYTIKKVKVCDRCRNIIHEQKLSILQCIHGFFVCMIYMFNCQPLTDNPLRVWSLLKLDIDISTIIST